MSRKVQRIGAAALAGTLAAALVLPVQPGFACGPYFPQTVFIQSRHPDVPMDKYAAGELGVVQPGYSRSFLVVAYRYFSGAPFDASEQKQLSTLWARRYMREDEWLGEKRHIEDGLQKWVEARTKREGLKDPQGLRLEEPGNIRLSDAGQENCLDDGFQTAVRTLGERVEQFGEASVAVFSWVRAQDAVFRNCAGRNPVTQNHSFPEPAPATLPALIRADRDYQIAAAHFYSGDWDDAEKRFLAIAGDASSPWKDIAKLVAIRCRIRAATRGAEDHAAALPILTDANERLERFLADPALAALHPAARRLQGFVAIRLNPAARLGELSRRIEHGEAPQSLMQDLDDYTQLLDWASTGASDDEDTKRAREKLGAGPEGRGGYGRAAGAMADWILTFQSGSKGAQSHALERWRATRELPWLVAALGGAHADGPALEELMHAAAGVPATSRGYLTVAFHRARLLAEAGRGDEARSFTEAVSRMPGKRLPDSARNLFLALRMKLARNLEEFLQFAPRRASFITTDPGEEGFPEPEEWCNRGPANIRAACEARRDLPPPLFDADASMILTEGLPLRVEAQAAASGSLPKALRLQIAQAAWVRAVLLADEKTALALAPTLASLSPGLANGVKDYESADSPAVRQFAAVLLLLRQPELHPYVYTGVGRGAAPGKIDAYRDNWWCTAAPQGRFSGGESYYEMYTKISGALRVLYPSGKTGSPSFLTPEERNDAGKEWAALMKLDSAPSWIAAQVVDWAKSHPDDPRVPETLHLAVRATRYGCVDVHTGGNSKAAFELLHRRYPKNEWTQKTPFWFN